MAEGTPGTAVPAMPPVPPPVPDAPLDGSSDDAQAMGLAPVTILRQIVAACTYPELLEDLAVPEGARCRARRILQEMEAGNIGGYNHEHRALGVPRRVAQFLQRRDGGVPRDPHSMVLTSGTSSILPFVMSLLVDETSACPSGVLVPVPAPPVHAGAAGLAGAVAVPYALAEEQGWAVDVGMVRQELRRARARCHPKVLCVVNPGDPTGHVLSRQNMVDIIQLVADENLLQLADEVGAGGGCWGVALAFTLSSPDLWVPQDRAFDADHPFVSFKRVLWEMGAPFCSTVQVISFYFLSKSIAGNGFRVGFLELVHVEQAVVRPFQVAQSIPRPCVLGRILLDILMEPPDKGDPIQQALEEPGQGGARACPRLQLPPRALRQAQELGLEPDVFFCQQLLGATGVLLAPGSEFGQPSGTQHVVVSLLPPAATLKRILLALTHFHATFIQAFS
ncbi:alanine aminotransferase 1-like [Indicator indicator]|uniref:alanine aminotransferase 1-like n=1 Tax=Indicator indicator TaxID=1002788 RepID=UPI0023DFEC94|nr:alanine aminotransferase 1-like [Indicator indicator]